MAGNSCPNCGANLTLVGKMHRCISRPAADTVTHATDSVTHATPAVTHADTRQARWRKAHKAQHAAQQRAYRARKRSANG